MALDIASVSPETRVEMQVMDFADPWDFEEVYGKLLDFARAYPFDPDTEDYLVHITTGTHVAQICLFLLTEAHYLPGRLLQTQPARGLAARRGRGTSSTSTCRATTASPRALPPTAPKAPAS
ncbi:MAG: RNA repair transcriptional activator RtcR family protein [Sphingomonas taxi]